MCSGGGAHCAAAPGDPRGPLATSFKQRCSEAVRLPFPWWPALAVVMLRNSCHGLQKHTFSPLTQKFLLAGMALLQMAGELGEAAGGVQVSSLGPTLKEPQLLRAAFSGCLTGEQNQNQLSWVRWRPRSRHAHQYPIGLSELRGSPQHWQGRDWRGPF